MHCPKCSSYTTSGRLQGVDIDLCPACQGIWLDRGELSEIVGTDKDLCAIPDGMKETRLSCPRCFQKLTEVPYQAERRILVDVCAGCNGVWLDSGEIDKIGKAAASLHESFPQKRLTRLQQENRRKEALSSVYGATAPAAKAPVTSRAAFLGKVYTLFVASLGVTALGAFVGDKIRADDHWGLWVLAAFATLFLSMFVRKVPVLNVVALFGFTFIEGLTISGTVAHYFGAGKGSLVLQSLLITTGVFLSLSAYVWVTRKDLTGWGPFLFTVLGSLIFSGLVMLVFSTPFLWMVWTWVSAVTFCGYVLHDTSRILLKDETDEYVIACLDLYLDFINLFLDILRILDYVDL